MEIIEVGQIVNTHGIRGEVKLNPWTDDLYELLDLEVFYDKNAEPLKVESSKVHKNVVIIKFSGINTMNDAEKMKGKTLYTEKTPLPEGRYYIKDLIGLLAYENDEPLGELTDVFNTGANDIYEIKTPEGKRIYLPVIDGVIGEVDLENKKIFVTVPLGLLDDDYEE
ncbi:MAG: 16S rRNA processing protein RimM [Clostridia bacterium]|nr:16S rRNA processing protein RimM [Clostridia bacterium]